MIVLDGKATSLSMLAETAAAAAELAKKAGRRPGLAVILAGDDPASQVYVRNKERACAEAGIASETFRLSAGELRGRLPALIDDLNERTDIDGILLQLPLPDDGKGGPDSREYLERIRPDKDVDGFHPVNMGKLTLGLPGLRPCTPAGVMELLRRYGLSLEGKRAVVIGRSNIVGKPLALMLSATDVNATVTVCHSRTKDMESITRDKDFLFAAIGKPKFVHAGMVKKGAVVVDVGINRGEDGKLCGDCDFDALARSAFAVTPVPGGIGPMTIALLLKNTVQAFAVHTQRS